MPGKFVVKKGTTGKFRFNLVSTKGQVVATSEAYTSKAAATGGIRSTMRSADPCDTHADAAAGSADPGRERHNGRRAPHQGLARGGPAPGSALMARHRHCQRQRGGRDDAHARAWSRRWAPSALPLLATTATRYDPAEGRTLPFVPPTPTATMSKVWSSTCQLPVDGDAIRKPGVDKGGRS